MLTDTKFTVGVHVQSELNLALVRLHMSQSLRQLLYTKALALSQQERGSFSMGKLTNLYINDVPKILECIVQGHYLWGTPFQVGLCTP